MALILDGTDGITSSGGTNVLQDDAVITANIADGAVSDAKIADGAVSDSKIANGAVTAAKLAAGAVPAPSTADVLSATAGASAGAVGTYAFLATVNLSSFALGSTIAGSSLFPVGVANAFLATSAVRLDTGGSVSGTWRVMGFKGPRVADNASAREATLFLRIS